MTIREEMLKEIKKNKYSFLKNNEHLGKNIIILGLGGSHAYGTDTSDSDWDWRGIALNSKEDILGLDVGFEQVVHNETDTTIYSFNKMIKLLTNCNPNTIEIGGLKPEHYLYISPIGKELLDNFDMFLSKKAIHTFGSYANSQLRRLDNKAARTVSQAEQEQHILNSINNASVDFERQFFEYSKDNIKLYLDDAIGDELNKEIFMDINLSHYPLRDWKGMWSAMNNIVKEYGKVGHRNKEAASAGKIGKHMMHLVRLYLMCFDILERGKIVTYREEEHDFLIDIRNGKYLDDNKQPVPEFFEIVEQLEQRLEYDKENTDLPDKPDYNRIKEFVMSVNERVVRGEV